MNLKKTEDNKVFQTDENEIEQVEEYIYIGHNLTNTIRRLTQQEEFVCLEQQLENSTQFSETQTSLSTYREKPSISEPVMSYGMEAMMLTLQSASSLRTIERA